MHAKNKTEFLKNDYWKASFSLCYCKVSFHFFFPHRPFFKNFSSLVHFFLFRNYSFLPFQTPICLRFSSFAGSSFPFLSNLRFRKTFDLGNRNFWNLDVCAWCVSTQQVGKKAFKLQTRSSFTSLTLWVKQTQNFLLFWCFFLPPHYNVFRSF